jgi:hypothetical protein
VKNEQFELLYRLPETLLIHKNCYDKANWDTKKRRYDIGMILSYEAGRWMEMEYTEIKITLLLFTACKNLPLHTQMKNTLLQTHQLLPIVIH